MLRLSGLFHLWFDIEINSNCSEQLLQVLPLGFEFSINYISDVCLFYVGAHYILMSLDGTLLWNLLWLPKIDVNVLHCIIFVGSVEREIQAWLGEP